jgi:transcription antitermination factor NusG
MATTGSNWYALSVKSRHEFTVSGELRRKGIETFLPSIMKVSQWKDRKKRVEFPLFPGYVFVSIAPDPEEFVKVVKTRGTVRFISLEPGHPTPVAVEEINALKIILDSGEQIDVYPGLKQGARVRVRSGIFQGAEGILTKKEDHHMLLISMELLGRSVGVKIFADDVEAA